MPHTIFLAGGTGYMGRRLIPELLARGNEVRALVRLGSEGKLPPGCRPVPGNALDSASFAAGVAGADTWVHLIGVAHPAPWKGDQFRAVDLASVRAAVAAAAPAGVRHFVYVSVAQPAPMMRAYIEVRAECEVLIRAAGLNATFVRPWYVLGPGHRWPLLLQPAYWLLEQLPTTREAARRLGLVTLDQMIAALTWSVENPAPGVRVLSVSEIRQAPSLKSRCCAGER
jgi:uncharacterized protein YbjT (DUF2867 family)